MHLVAIGGSDAGISAALRARELDSEAEVTVVVADAFPNFSICGIPCYVSGEVAHWRNLAHRTIADLEATGAGSAGVADPRGLGGEVDRRGDAIELVELLLDPRRTRRARHPADRKLHAAPRTIRRDSRPVTGHRAHQPLLLSPRPAS